MFEGTSKPINICLRCRLSLDRLATQPRSPKYSLNSSHVRRWQSNGPVAHTNATTSESIPVLHDNSKPRSEPKTRSARIWRPPIELGYESMGKPAEVLVLPLPQWPGANKPGPQKKSRSTEVSERTSGSLRTSEYFELESKPVSWEDIKGNIESVRLDALSRQEKRPTEAKYEDLQHRLAEGFTKDQLIMYIESHVGSEKQHKTVSKQYLVSKIITQIWNLRPAEPELSVIETPDEETQSSVKVGKVFIELVLSPKSRFLGLVSEKFGVQVDAFRQTSPKRPPELILTGPSEAVSEARGVIQRSAQNVLTVPITDSRLSSLAGVVKLHEYMDVLMRKYPVFMTKKPTGLYVSALDHKSITSVERDIFQIHEPTLHNTPLVRRDHTLISDLHQVPVRPGGFRHWLHEQAMWFRNIRDQTPSTFEFREALLRKLEASETREISTLLRNFRISPVQFQQNFEIGLGQVLFNKEVDQHVIPRRTFSTEIASLSQWLRTKQAISGSGSRPPTTFVFRFRPISAHNVLPSFEVWMTGEDVNKGIKQPLHMQRITAIFQETVYNALVPHRSIDLRFVSRTFFDIFSRNAGAPEARLLPLLQQFTGIVQLLQADDDSSTDLIRSINIDCLLTRRSTAAKPRSHSGEVRNRTPRDVRDVLKAQGITPEGIGRLALHEQYIVEAPEMVDVSSYEITGVPDLRLEHVLYDTVSGDSPRCRQALRIVEQQTHKLAKETPSHVQKRSKQKSDSDAWIISDGPSRVGTLLDAADVVSRDLERCF